jgi:hypothetical protein
VTATGPSWRPRIAGAPLASQAVTTDLREQPQATLGSAHDLERGMGGGVPRVVVAAPAQELAQL